MSQNSIGASRSGPTIEKLNALGEKEAITKSAAFGPAIAVAAEELGLISRFSPYAALVALPAVAGGTLDYFEQLEMGRPADEAAARATGVGSCILAQTVVGIGAGAYFVHPLAVAAGGVGGALTGLATCSSIADLWEGQSVVKADE